MTTNIVFTKSKLTPVQLAILQSEVEKRKPNTAVAYLLWFFLGAFGAHRFYLKNPVRGVFMLLTLGGLGFWALIDVFFINKRIRQITEQIESEVMANLNLMTQN